MKEIDKRVKELRRESRKNGKDIGHKEAYRRASEEILGLNPIFKNAIKSTKDR